MPPAVAGADVDAGAAVGGAEVGAGVGAGAHADKPSAATSASPITMDQRIWCDMFVFFLSFDWVVSKLCGYCFASFGSDGWITSFAQRGLRAALVRGADAS